MPRKVDNLARTDFDLAVRRMNLQDYARVSEAIGRGRDHWGRMGLATRREFDTFLLTRERHPESIAYAIGVARGPEVVAFVNDNRWMARCECGGLAVVDPDEPEFYCHGCFNMANGGVPTGRGMHGGYPRPILFPGKQEHNQIENALLVSDDPLWRNWSPLAEDEGQPGESRSNRAVSPEEMRDSIARLEDANEAADLPRRRTIEVME